MLYEQIARSLPRSAAPAPRRAANARAQQNPGGLLGSLAILGLAGVGAVVVWRHFAEAKVPLPKIPVPVPEPDVPELPPPASSMAGKIYGWTWYAEIEDGYANVSVTTAEGETFDGIAGIPDATHAEIVAHVKNWVEQQMWSTSGIPPFIELPIGVDITLPTPWVTVTCDTGATALTDDPGAQYAVPVCFDEEGSSRTYLKVRRKSPALDTIELRDGNGQFRGRLRINFR